jgi:hypothetical protein
MKELCMLSAWMAHISLETQLIIAEELMLIEEPLTIATDYHSV